MDEFLFFLREKRLIYDSMLKISKLSRSTQAPVAAFCVEMVLESIDEIITRYEKFVKEQKDVANLS